MSPVKSVAVIGLGPAGAIALDALVREQKFDVVKVFERREAAGGCWIQDPPTASQELPDLNKIASRTADDTPEIPSDLPRWAPRPQQYRFADTSIYPNLETNICARAMEFSEEPIPGTLSSVSLERHGVDSPFRSHVVIKNYLDGLVNRNNYRDLVSFNTNVELIQRSRDGSGPRWELTLRREGVPHSFSSPSSPSSHAEQPQDYWYKEQFDAVVVASGHYTVPFIPHVEGLVEFKNRYPGSVEHSKSFRGVEKYHGKNVLVVGSSISAPDITFALALASEDTGRTVHASIHSDKYHPYFGDHAFRHPCILRHGPISHIVSTDGERTVHFEDGSILANVDHIIYGTGYSWTMPFLPDMPVRNNRVPGLFAHVFPMDEAKEGIVFVGAVAAGFTFKVFEWQAVLASRFLSGRLTLPPLTEQLQWEAERVARKGDGVPFTALYPDFEEYFEQARRLVEQSDGTGGRQLPKFEKEWEREFSNAHLFRIRWWQRENSRADRDGIRTINGGKEC